MIQVHSPFERNELELRMLAICLKDMSSLDKVLPVEFFGTTANRNFYIWLKGWVLKYNNLPTDTTVTSVTDSEIVDVYSAAAPFVDKVSALDFDYYLDLLHKEYLRGVMFQMANTISLELHEKDPEVLAREIMNTTPDLMKSLDKVGSSRGWVWESADARWGTYELRETDPAPQGIPSGIGRLDELMLGGFRKSEVALVFGPTSAGKSRLLLNIGYNQSMIYLKKVLYISLEMSRELLESCFDSRHGELDYDTLATGKLTPVNRAKYKTALAELTQKKPNFYVVDNPGDMTTVGLMSELNLYRSKMGCYPDSVIVDYANLMEPMGSYNGRSEKFDFMFNQFKRLARQYDISLITATQESRKATELESRDETNVEHIGLSHYMAPHCAIVLHIYQDGLMKDKNEIALSLLKNRYGALDKFTVLALWPINYIGDNKDMRQTMLEVKSK